MAGKLESCRRNSAAAATDDHRIDLHKCYQEAVQNPRKEIINLQQIYHDLADGGPLRVLREDFCGTAILCGEWVRRHVDNRAIAVDLDEKVLEYGRRQFRDGTVADKVDLVHANVLSVDNTTLAKADMLVALNYGVCYFHTFSLLHAYVKKCFEAVRPGGVVVCDGFGGTRSPAEPWQFRRRCSHFDYLFDQSPIEILTNRTHCTISFKFRGGDGGSGRSKGGSGKVKAFSYDFRAWSVCEMAEAMRAAGFEGVVVWVAESRDGGVSDGDGDGGSDGEESSAPGTNAFVKITSGRDFRPSSEFWSVYVAGRRPSK
jgi:SAM-dependent methyltransferase